MADIKLRRARWAVAAMFFVNGFIMGAWAPQIPLLLPRHGITESGLGLLILVLGVGAVGAMLFAGRLIAIYGARLMLTLFSLASVAVLPLVVLAPSLISVALAMALMGAVAGCMDVSMNANAVEVERGLGRAIMSSSHGFWSLGGFVGSALGGLALARYGAEAQAAGDGVVCLAVVAVAIRFLIGDGPGPTRETGHRHAALLPRDPGLWLLGLMALLSMIPEGAVLDWGAIYLGKDYGAGIAGASLAFALFSAAMAVMRFSGDAIRNKFGAVRTLRVSGLIGAAGLMMAALSPEAWMVTAGFAISGIGVANMVPIMFSAAGNQPGHGAGIGIATVTMVGYSGILVAPSSIGFVAEAIGFPVTFGTLSVLLVLVAALADRAAVADTARAKPQV